MIGLAQERCTLLFKRETKRAGDNPAIGRRCLSVGPDGFVLRGNPRVNELTASLGMRAAHKKFETAAPNVHSFILSHDGECVFDVLLPNLFG